MKIQELTSSTGKVYLTIHYDEQNKWLYNDWTGYVTPENVKQGGLAVLDAIKQHRTALGLNDNRNLVGRWDDALAWIEQEWIPAAAEAGLRYYAHVVDADSFAAASSADMLNRVQGRFQMRIFQNMTDAREWLNSCQSSTTNT